MKYIDNPIAFKRYLYHDCHCINAGQTPEERRLKYAIARYFGKCRKDAIILRDYRKSTFSKFFGYSSWNSLYNTVKGVEWNVKLE